MSMGQVIVTTHECHFRPSFSKFAGYYFLRPTKKWMESADGRWVLKFKKNIYRMLQLTRLVIREFKNKLPAGNVLWIDHQCIADGSNAVCDCHRRRVGVFCLSMRHLRYPG